MLKAESSDSYRVIGTKQDFSGFHSHYTSSSSSLSSLSSSSGYNFTSLIDLVNGNPLDFYRPISAQDRIVYNALYYIRCSDTRNVSKKRKKSDSYKKLKELSPEHLKEFSTYGLSLKGIQLNYYYMNS